MRRLLLLWAAVLLVTACSAGPASASRTSPTAVSPPLGATTVPGGCGTTPIYSGAIPPAWVHSFQGSSPPYVLASPPSAAGFLFGYPLRAGHPQNPANKILWEVSLPPYSGSLDIIAHPVGATSPTVNQSVAFLASGELPSIVDMPQPGCWHFDLTWSEHHATVEVGYQ